MNLSNASATTGLSSRAVPVSATVPLLGKRLTAPAQLGASITIAYPLASIHYDLSMTASAASDEVAVDLFNGECSGGAGAPVMPNNAIDFSGVPLPLAAKMCAVRFTAPDANDSAVLIVATVSEAVTTIPCFPGQVATLQFPSAGLTMSVGDGLSVTFNHAGDALTVEVIAVAA
jgi:hypothetical protein